MIIVLVGILEEIKLYKMLKGGSTDLGVLNPLSNGVKVAIYVQKESQVQESGNRL